MAINWFGMPAEGLSNGGQFEIKELTATENKVYEKAGEVYNKVTVNVEGGGGSSDFSTAEVTIVNNSSTSFNPQLAIIEDETLKSTGNITKQNSATFNEVLLYKGSRSFAVALLTPTVEGNASVSGSTVTITGDCVITLTGGL